MRITWSIGSATPRWFRKGESTDVRDQLLRYRKGGKGGGADRRCWRGRHGCACWLAIHRRLTDTSLSRRTLQGGVGNELQVSGPARRRDSFFCGNRFQSCSCKRRSARPAGPAPAGHDEELLSGRPIWFWQIGRVRWRQIFRRLILAPMDDSLHNRPSVLLRLCGRRRTTTGSATAWRLRR